MIGIVDSTIIVRLFRKDTVVQQWLQSLKGRIGVTPITWLEVMRGSHSKSAQQTALSLLAPFDVVYLTMSDQMWAMEQMQTYRLSRGIEMNDCLIASVCARLQIPIYTHNVKDMLKILPSHLVIQPHSSG
ncbi:MAG: PIN domain-containing protein [Anaerolineae bacterium]|nr:PIN domain-containing protein [Anaerolineae bacterium]